MTKYKIILDRMTCIGAFSCVVVGGGEDLWVMDPVEGKVNMKMSGASKTPDLHEFITEDEEMVKKAIASGEVCPVLAIKVVNLDTGEWLLK